MNASTFARQRARIERNANGRRKYRERAMRHLVREAGAALVIMDRKIVGYRLPNGQLVCVKERFYSEHQAHKALHRIEARQQVGRVPVRAYECPHCAGWHLTSQATPHHQQVAP